MYGTKFKAGDVYTIQGYYKKRTLWQWLKRQPKELQRWIILKDCAPCEYSEIKPLPEN